MKSRALSFLAGIAMISCSENEPEEALPTYIDDEPIAIRSITATKDGEGVFVRITAETAEITILYESFTTGSYNFVEPGSFGTTVASTIHLDGEFYEAFDGHAALHVFNDGTIGGFFELEARSSGKIIHVKGGRFSVISVTTQEDCRLTRHSSSTDGFIDFFYNDRGTVSHTSGINDRFATFRAFYDDYRLLKIIRNREGVDETGTVIYDNDGRLTSIEYAVTPPEVIEFEYDGEGRLVMANGKCISYSGGNAVEVGCVDGTTRIQYTGFDNKSNVGQILSPVVQNQPALLFYFFGEDGQYLSQNNPGKREIITNTGTETDNFTYEQYNNQGFPVSYTVKRGNATENVTNSFVVCL